MLAACPCFMCQPPACSSPPGLTPKGGSVGLAPPGSPGSYDSEVSTSFPCRTRLHFLVWRTAAACSARQHLQGTHLM